MFLAFVEDNCWPDILDEISTDNVIIDHNKIADMIVRDPGKFPDLINTSIVFNLNSLLLTGYRLNALTDKYVDPGRVPIFNYDASSMPPWMEEYSPMTVMNREEISRNFDINYARMIESNMDAFIQLYSIIYTLYNGANCYVLIGTDSQYKRMITDSIMKYIQQKYDISPIGYIACLDDYKSYDKNTKFTLNGIYNIDKDRETFIMNAVDFKGIEDEYE